jgi:site-specific recombinase
MFFLRTWAIWRRFRRGSPARRRYLQYGTQVEQLMRRASPFAAWTDRANWMMDLAEWLRHEPRTSLREDSAWRRARHQRTRYLLDWLDAHRDVRRLVQATIQKTLREAVGPELFTDTGMAREPAFFSELAERAARLLLPPPPARNDLCALFCAMFPDPADAEWLLGLDGATLMRLWRLVADDGISHGYMQQLDEALQHLATMVLAAGTGAEFRRRLPPRMPVQATPFMALRRELERYLFVASSDETALRSVRMLIAVCQAQTDKIYADLDEHGVSVSLVWQVERMRSQLARMARLIEVRAAVQAGRGGAEVQALLAELVHAHHQRASGSGLATRSFSLLARKIVERQGRHGERHLARDPAQYQATLKAGAIGGAVVALTVLAQLLWPGPGAGGGFFGGVSAAASTGLCLLLISALGGVLGGRQPAIIAPALAARMGALDTAEGLRALMSEIAMLLRSQAAAVFGNLAAVTPAMLALTLATFWGTGGTVLSPARARDAMAALSLVGPTPLYAALTGVLLWLAGLASGLADNWFALHRMRHALAHQRRLVYALGAARAQRFAHWLERHVADIAGSIALAALLGMTPALAAFFGLPFQVRHVTLAAGTLLATLGSLGWQACAEPAFWLAVAGVLAAGLLNVAVAFGCALALALQARAVPPRAMRRVAGAVLRRFAASPRTYLLPDRQEQSAPAIHTKDSGRNSERKVGRR